MQNCMNTTGKKKGVILLLALIVGLLGCSGDDLSVRPVDGGIDIDGGIDSGDEVIDQGQSPVDSDVASDVGTLSDAFTVNATVDMACTHFVSTNGSDDNSGTSEATAWQTMTYAAAQATPGEKVCIKAGDYGDERVVVAHDGTLENPIIFEGYRDIPGDDPDLGWSYPNRMALNANVMPMLNGSSRASHIGIQLSGRSHVRFSNIQVRNYKIGISMIGSSHIVLSNAILEDFGDIYASYDGYGVHIAGGGHHNTINKTVVLNAAAQAFTIFGHDNVVADSKAYGTDDRNYKSATAYYFVVRGDNNTIINSYAERKSGLLHNGHGFIVKYNGTGNLFQNNTVVNMIGAYEARHKDVHNNLWLDCTALGTDAYTAGINIEEDAHDNTFRNFTADGVGYGLRFYRTGEIPEDIGFGRGNIIEDSTFKNITKAAIYFEDIVHNNPVAKDNLFKNVTFKNVSSLYRFNSNNGGNGQGEGNQFINCTFDNISQYITGQGDPGATYTNCIETNLGFQLP
jgi:hypothetical protein